MIEELNLEGKWWVPERENQKFYGKLTFNRDLKRYTLSIISGPNFEQSEMGLKDRPTHAIILGVTSERQKVTLIDCEIIGFYTIKAENILLGVYFQRPEDIVLSSIYVTYRGIEINQWFDKRFKVKGFFESSESREKESFVKYTRGQSVKAEIEDIYNITILAKPRVIPSFEGTIREAYIKETLGIEIESLSDEKKSLEDYFEVNRVVLDFLNFVFPQEVHIESIHGIREKSENSGENTPQKPQKREEVKIIYPYGISKMFKPTVRTGVPIFPYNYLQENSIQPLFEKYLKNWLELSETPLIKLYCAVMYNPDMYIEYRFLGLAEAIESYHRSFLQKPSPYNWDNEIDAISKSYPQIPLRCIKKIKECYNPDLSDRVAEVFSEYSEIAGKLLYFKDKECFSNRVARTRNYLSHWSERNRRKASLGEDLVHLTRDVQFVLQLCIMTQLGFTKCDFANMYHTNKL